MQITDEIRWFFEGDLSPEIIGWFHDGAPIAPAPKRTDIYLPLAASFALSIKLREGRLEFKTQSGPSRDVTYLNGVAGRAAAWKKERYRTQLFADIERQLANPAALHVVKERHLRKFCLREGQPAEISTGETPMQGCLFELTQLWLDEIPSWTIALEAFGTPGPLDHNLAVTATDVFSRAPCPVALTARSSASYPEWLPTRRRSARRPGQSAPAD